MDPAYTVQAWQQRVAGPLRARSPPASMPDSLTCERRPRRERRQDREGITVSHHRVVCLQQLLLVTLGSGWACVGSLGYWTGCLRRIQQAGTLHLHCGLPSARGATRAMPRRPPPCCIAWCGTRSPTPRPSIPGVHAHRQRRDVAVDDVAGGPASEPESGHAGSQERHDEPAHAVRQGGRRGRWRRWGAIITWLRGRGGCGLHCKDAGELESGEDLSRNAGFGWCTRWAGSGMCPVCLANFNSNQRFSQTHLFGAAQQQLQRAGSTS